MRIRALVGYLLLGAASTAIAQHHGPYTGQQNREIKALSPQEMQNYLEGKGMGYAKAAELNHYPGPAHALELADRLELTSEQRAAVERLGTTMAKNGYGQYLLALLREPGVR